MMRSCFILIVIVLAWLSAPALAGDRIIWMDADGGKPVGDMPWQGIDFDRDLYANRLCYDDGCYFRGHIGGKLYHTYNPGIYRYDYQHRYHRIIPHRHGLFSPYRHHGRYLRPYGFDFTSKRLTGRYYRYSPSRGQSIGRHSVRSVRTGVDRIRERARFGRR